MKATFNAKFLIQQCKAKADGRCTILARITVNGVMTHVSTKFQILPERWNVKEGKTLGHSREEKEINSHLETLHASIVRRYYDLQAAGKELSAHRLKMELTSTDEEKNISVNDLFERFINDYEKLVLTQDYGKESFCRYKVCRDRVQEFMKKEYKVHDMPLTAINKRFLDKLYLYLRTERKINNNTAVKFMHRFSSVYKMARDNGWIVGDPFKLQHLHIDKVDRGFLTTEELEIIYNHEFASARLETIRDIFIFCCYTGLPYIDAKNLKKTQFIKWADGNQWLTLNRTKTKVPVNVRLLDVPLMIIRKYEDRMKDSNYLLPVPSNQKCNEYLKEIADLCGIDKVVTFHVARHTFATTVTLGNGVPIESVSKMLGHTSVRTTQIYARITDQKVNNDMEVLAQKLNPKYTQAPAISVEAKAKPKKRAKLVQGAAALNCL